MDTQNRDFFTDFKPFELFYREHPSIVDAFCSDPCVSTIVSFHSLHMFIKMVIISIFSNVSSSNPVKIYLKQPPNRSHLYMLVDPNKRVTFGAKNELSRPHTPPSWHVYTIVYKFIRQLKKRRESRLIVQKPILKSYGTNSPRLAWSRNSQELK